VVTTDAIAEEVSLLADAFTAAELQHETFEPLREFIPGVVAEGFSILGGGPKMGKSYMGLDFSLANSMGGLALGCIPVEECDVLYLALEDSKRRLQARIKQLLPPGQGWPSRLVLLTKVLPGQVTATIAQWYKYHPKSLVILDTLTKNRPQRAPGADPYIAD
jgi:predicted ATP-dependent serine protease